jgi:hypothetical protein
MSTRNRQKLASSSPTKLVRIDCSIEIGTDLIPLRSDLDDRQALPFFAAFLSHQLDALCRLILFEKHQCFGADTDAIPHFVAPVNT